MTNLEMWALLVGSGLPFLLRWVMSTNWSKATRSAIGVVASTIAAGVTFWLSAPEGFELSRDLVSTVLTVIIATQATYLAFWKNVLPDQKA